MEKFKLVLIIGCLCLLAGCGFKYGPIEAAADKEILIQHTLQVQAKATAVGVIAGACKIETADPGACGGDASCVAMVIMANQNGARDQSDCVQAVAHEAGEVAIQIPERRLRGAAAVAHEFVGGGSALDNNFGIIGGMVIGKAAFDFGKTAVRTTANALTTAGRPNVDNSVVTTTTTSGDTVGGNLGDTTTVGGNLGDTQIVDNGSQVGDRGHDNSGNTGRIGSPGDNNNQVDNSDNAFAGCTVIPIVSLPGSFTVRCDPTP